MELHLNKRGHQGFHHSNFQQILYNFLIDSETLQPFQHCPKILHYHLLVVGYLLVDLQTLLLEQVHFLQVVVQNIMDLVDFPHRAYLHLLIKCFKLLCTVITTSKQIWLSLVTIIRTAWLSLIFWQRAVYY